MVQNLKSFSPRRLSERTVVVNARGKSKSETLKAGRGNQTGGDQDGRNQRNSHAKRNAGKPARDVSQIIVSKGRGPRRTFHVELRNLWEKSGLVQRTLAAQIGVSYTLLNNWITGNSPPSRNYKEVIHELEKIFGVEHGYLWSLVRLRSRKGRAEKGRYDGITDPPAKRTKVTRNFTGAEMRLPPSAFRKRYDEAAAKRLERADPRTMQILNSRNLGKHQELPERVKTDLENFVDLSTRTEWHVGSALLPLKQRVVGGAKMEARRLTSVLDYLCSSPRGPEVAPEKLTFGVFLFPDCSSSDNLRPIRHFENGGSGSSGVRV